jgi:mannitol-1-phosphate/altronate dehydrogenase
LQQGKSIECLSFCVAAWIHFVQKKISQKEQLHDPLQTLLRDLIGVEGSSQATQVMQHSGVFAPELLEAGLPELVALYFKMISDKGISTALDHIVLQQDNSSAVR